MKAERSVRESGKARVIFCLVLIAALVCGTFAMNGFAAGADPANYDVKVDSCTTHTAAVSKGDLYVWGSNESGQFPESELLYSVEPVQVASDVADVAVSPDRTLVLYKNGDLYAYGLDPLSEKSGLAEKIAANVKQISCSDTFALYVTKRGALMAWGANGSGQLGTGNTKSCAKPTQTIASGVVKAVAGQDFGLALKDDGSLYGWGSNYYQQLGLTDENGSAVDTAPAPLMVTDHVQDMDAGDSFSCILKDDGSLYTCGMNTSSQTGVATLALSTPMTKVLDHVRSVSAGDAHCFAIGSNGKVYSWGYGLSGQLGNGDSQRVIGATASDLDYVQIFAGDGTSFGVDANGAVWSWGDNTNRVLCTASGVDALQPVKVLNADMTWAGNGSTDEEVPSQPSHSVSGGVSEEPIRVKVPFIKGYKDQTFKPYANITRAEFLAMVVGALTDYDADTTYPACTFDDVAEGQWYAPVFAYAQNGNPNVKLINGYGDGTCHPNEPITRAEAAKITAAALKLTSSATTSSFEDVTAKWAIPAIEVLAENHILSGDADTGLFRPNDYLTRAEAAKVVGAYGFNSLFGNDLDGMREQIKLVENPFPGDVGETKWYYPYILYATGKLS